MFKRLIIPVLILAAAFGIMQWLGTFRKEQQRTPPRPFIRTVSTQKIHYEPLRPTITSMGRVTTLERVQLTPEVSGLVLESGFRLRKSRTFRKGDVLLRIDSSQIYFGYSATVSELQNALAGMLPELATDHPDALDAWKSFFSRCSIDTLPPLPTPESDREKLLATRYSIYRLYYLAQQQRNTLEKHTIRAPFAGTVEETQVYPSSMARAGVAAATIVRTDAVEIELALTEDQTPFVRQGMNVSAMIEGLAQPVEGSIHRISNVLDQRMQTAAAFVRIEGGDVARCKTGAYARVAIPGAEIDRAVAVPRKALHDKSFVYIINADTLAERKVAAAYLAVDTAYLTGGIDEGAVLIAEPLQDAVIGMAVQDVARARERRMREEATGTGAQKKKNGKTAGRPVDATPQKTGGKQGGQPQRTAR